MLAGVVVVTVGVVVDTTSLHSKSEHGQPPLQFFYLQKYINDIQDLYRSTGTSQGHFVCSVSNSKMQSSSHRLDRSH